MTVSSIPSLGRPNPLDSVPAGSGVTTANAAEQGPAAVSSLGQLLSQLQGLQQTDPTKLQTVLTDVANQLEAAAQQDTGPDRRALSSLASKFQEAAQTGNLSALRPAHPHHHGHHHGVAAYQSSQQTPSTSSDPRNQLLDILRTVLDQSPGTTGPSAG